MCTKTKLGCNNGNKNEKNYMTPRIRLREVYIEPLLADSTIDMKADPNEKTDEALSKERAIWDNDN